MYVSRNQKIAIYFFFALAGLGFLSLPGLIIGIAAAALTIEIINRNKALHAKIDELAQNGHNETSDTDQSTDPRQNGHT